MPITHGVYQFGYGKRQAKPEITGIASRFKSEKEIPLVMQPIQGKMPQSLPEYYVALALMRLKIDFEFQKGIGGGRSIRGGQVLDFLVDTKPFPTPVFVQGGYWHDRGSELEDDMKQKTMSRYFKGQVMPNVLINAEDITTPADAYRIIKEEIGNG